ncbi:CerR family C-terminal domain-containing protein [Xylophilus sp. GW821-FHT01B05]
MPAPSATSPSPTSSPRAQRADGAEARQRLLLTALRLFSEQGFARTSTRQVAEAAGVNLAAIRYYFADKAGLYLAALTEPLGAARDLIPLYDQPQLSLRASLQAYIHYHLQLLRQGEIVQQCMRLHMREMLEPTGQWAEELEQDVGRQHAALVGILRRRLGLARADDDVHRLAFSIAGLCFHLITCHDLLHGIRPSLIATPRALDTWCERLVQQALALAACEAARRGLPFSPDTSA